MIEKNEHVVAGADFGSDSVRVVILDAADGEILGQCVSAYPRWKQGLYCEPKKNQFRQHPLDYIDSFTEAFLGALDSIGIDKKDIRKKIRALSIDTTGSTPVLADIDGRPLSLSASFAEDPDAMFILWKDHTAVNEADEINKLARTWGGIDYTKYSGGVYSSEWFWAKILHTVRKNIKVCDAAYTAIEHCDWITANLTGTENPSTIKRSRCAAGHKVLWHREWGGYPSEEFFSLLHPALAKIRNTLGSETWTTNTVAGTLTAQWAKTLGLLPETIVCVGAYDAHIGAVGGDAAPGVLVKSIGTSTCDVIIGPPASAENPEKLIPGICGQVDGSVVPGWIGYEAGQSAYGDYYAWLRTLLMWPVKNLIDPTTVNIEHIEKDLLKKLEQAAEEIHPTESSIVALDWINGRRTPWANQKLRAAITGIDLGTDAPTLMRALLESTAYGARSIIETFEAGGLHIEKIMAIGGVARKSILGMQILADVTNRDIHVTAGDQSCAIGAAVFAATAAGLYPDVFAAQKAISAGTERIHHPDSNQVAIYNKLYEKFQRLGNFIEGDKL